MNNKKPITFSLKNGSKVNVMPLDPQDDMGVRYDFIITHKDGSNESFVYTPPSSMSQKQKEQRSEGSMTMAEQEALLIFQNTYQ